MHHVVVLGFGGRGHVVVVRKKKKERQSFKLQDVSLGKRLERIEKNDRNPRLEIFNFT